MARRLLGHMHEWGTRMKLVRERTDGTRDTLYEVQDWTVEYRDQPPLELFTPNDPLVIEPGEKLLLTCAWSNDTAKTLRFPTEMCTSVGYYYPAEENGLILCD